MCYPIIKLLINHSSFFAWYFLFSLQILLLISGHILSINLLIFRFRLVKLFTIVSQSLFTFPSYNFSALVSECLMFISTSLIVTLVLLRPFRFEMYLFLSGSCGHIPVHELLRLFEIILCKFISPLSPGHTVSFQSANYFH